MKTLCFLRYLSNREIICPNLISISSLYLNESPDLPFLQGKKFRRFSEVSFQIKYLLNPGFIAPGDIQCGFPHFGKNFSGDQQIIHSRLSIVYHLNEFFCSLPIQYIYSSIHPTYINPFRSIAGEERIASLNVIFHN